jgi:hypothetical protein
MLPAASAMLRCAQRQLLLHQRACFRKYLDQQVIKLLQDQLPERGACIMAAVGGSWHTMILQRLFATTVCGCCMTAFLLLYGGDKSDKHAYGQNS